MGYYTRAERKRQIVWHMMNSWTRHRDKRWTAKIIADTLGMAKSQHLLTILAELENAGVISSSLEPFRGLPRRFYTPILASVQTHYLDVWGEFAREEKRGNSITVNGGAQAALFPDWREK